MREYFITKVFADGKFLNNNTRVIRFYPEQTNGNLLTKQKEQLIGKSSRGSKKFLNIIKWSGEVYLTAEGSIFRIYPKLEDVKKHD